METGESVSGVGPMEVEPPKERRVRQKRGRESPLGRVEELTHAKPETTHLGAEIQILKDKIASLKDESNPGNITTILEQTHDRIIALRNQAAKHKHTKRGKSLEEDIPTILHGVKQTVIAVAHKAASEAQTQPGALDVAVKAFQWLADVDKQNSLFYLINVAKARASCERYLEALDAISQIELSLPLSLQKELHSVLKSKDSAAVMNLLRKVEQFGNEVHGVVLLERSLKAKEGKATPLTDEENSELEAFLLLAIGNKEMNKRLRETRGRTAAEKTLVAFTYRTQKIDELMQSVERVDAALESSHLTEFLEGYRVFVTSWNNLEKAFEELSEDAPTSAYLPSRGVIELNEQVALLRLTPSKPASQQLFDPERFQKLTKLREGAIQLHETMVAEIKKIDDQDILAYETTIEEKIKKIIELLNTQLELFPRITEQRANFLIKISSSDYKPPLQISDIRNLTSMAETRDVFLTIKDPKDIRIREAQGKADRSNQLIADLDDLMQALPSYLPGDILFEDEAMNKQYQGEGGIVFSRMSAFHEPVEFATNMYGALKSWNVFRVQPYFTGSLMHATQICCEDGRLRNCEVPEGFSGDEVPFSTPLTYVTFRPNFVALLSPEGREALDALWGPMNDDQLQERLSSYYSESLAKFASEHEEEMGQIMEINRTSAAFAYLEDVTTRALSPLQHMTSAIAATTLHLAGVSERMRVPPTPEQFQIREAIFCSEFVARSITEIERLVNERLNEVLQQSRPESAPVQFLRPAIPHEVSKTSIHPNKLESLLTASGAYVRGPLPVATRLLVSSESLAPSP